ncbi:MAG: class I adenylate-forming enzyme family protein [Ferrimicrobium sp.]
MDTEDPIGNGSRPRLEGWSWGEWSRQCWRRHIDGRCDPEPGFSGRTLGDLALAAAKAYPERLAVRVDGEAHTFRTLAAEASLVSGWLACNINLTDRVMIAAPFSLGWVEAYLGVLMAGGVAVLANPSYSSHELAQLVEDSGAVLVLSAGEALQRCSALRACVVDLTERPWLGATPSEGCREGLTSESIALLGYTSGTTGQPKGVPLSHGQLISSISSAVFAWRWSREDVVVHSLPLYHQHGLGALHASWCTGSATVLLSRFDSSQLATIARETGATVLFAVPTIYRRLVDEIDSLPREDQQALRSLRLRVCGSALLDEELAREIAIHLGAPALVRYGLTESGLDVSQPFDASFPDTIGVPLPGIELRLVHDGKEVDPGVEGEIQMRGPQIFKGYWNNPEATVESIDLDGWFRTGDIAVLDDSTGQLRIRGRIKELIITGGLNVYPREVELALESHSRVLEAGVAGVPDKHWGEQVTAWVAIKDSDPIDEADLIEYTRGLLAAYKCPKRVYVVESLPRNPMGKLQRARLSPPEAESV